VRRTFPALECLEDRLVPAATTPQPAVSGPAVVAQSATTAAPSVANATFPPGYFHTSGNQILGSNNQPVKIAGVNWFGMESSTFAPDGLWARNYQDMIDQMAAEGFNAIRLPFSDQLFDPTSVPNSINYSLNPDLKGLNGLQIMDKVVAAAGKDGMRVLLDHHRSDAGSGPNASGLWYTSAYPESTWLKDWTMLATHYANNPTVIGADLSNEPHGQATWGTGDPSTDWRLAAEKGGNAILAVNPNWLIIVEGTDNGPSGFYWWGGNLSNAAKYPVQLNSPGHLVYSVHDYPASVHAQAWFSAPNYPNNLPSVWNKNWGYLYQDNTAPILLGEFGSKLQTTPDNQWANAMVQYLSGGIAGASGLPAGKLGPSWTWWSWNPNSGDTGGILQDDWKTVNQNKVNLLKPIEFPPRTGLQQTTSSPATPTPTSASPSPSAGATASQLSRVALEAFLVAEGIFTGNDLLVGLGAAEVLFFTDGLPSGVQSQLLSASIQDTIAGLAALNLTSPS
jgi:aryl-phospho-beta-D-glucosidase BglC (GH1 family)